MVDDLFVVFNLLHLQFGVGRGQQVPRYFVFGDSLVDNGNDNQLNSLAKANYLPYGIDYPGGPTGRFSNGKTTIDVIELLGFNRSISPYATANGHDILRGLNYALAVAGIREETGRQLGERIAFAGQVQNYQKTVSQVTTFYWTAQQFTPETYASDLSSQCN